MLLCYAIIILMLILFNDVCFYYFSARWEVEASMMMIGQCANKVSVCFVKRSPRSSDSGRILKLMEIIFI